MRLEIEIVPAANAASNWRLNAINKLEELLDSLQIKDYSIALLGDDGRLIDLLEPEAPAETEK